MGWSPTLGLIETRGLVGSTEAADAAAKAAEVEELRCPSPLFHPWSGHSRRGVSCVLPILLKLIKQARGEWRRENFGPWSLGVLSVPVNIFALLWGAVVLVLYYLVSVRHWFKGPRGTGSEDELSRIEQELEKESIYKESTVA